MGKKEKNLVKKEFISGTAVQKFRKEAPELWNK